MSETENLMHTQRFGALVGKEAMHGGSADSEASKEAEVGASSGHSGSEEAQSVSQGEKKLFFLCPYGWAHQDPCLGDGEVTGG